jgi:Tol biopolymer transport system component
MSRGLLVAVGLMLIFGATALARTGEQAARPRTLAKVRGSVFALAQDGQRIAWMKTARGCERMVQILSLPARRPVYVDSPTGKSCSLRGGSPDGLALSADGRALWQRVTEEANTYLTIGLATAALRDRHIHLVGESAIQKSSDPDYVDRSPLPIAADGHAILFYANCEIGDICGRRPPAIYRLVGRGSRRLAKVKGPTGLAVSGRRFAVVTNSLRCCNFTPAWSHDGTRIAWIYHGNLWTVRADGTGDRRLAAGLFPPYWEGKVDDARRPSWSPDDARLVFERAEAKESRLRNLGVYRVDANGGGLRRLGAGTAPVWSPDGTTVAFVRDNGVFAMTPDGTGAKRLTPTRRATPGPLSWSPDSTRIAVSRGGDIYSVRADGGGETRLTTSSRPEARPAWSPDGATIAYVDGSAIAVVNRDGTGARRLTGGSDLAPAWSPDSKRVAFVRGSVVWVVNADGSGQRRLTPANQPLYSPQWAPGGAIVVGDGNLDPLAYTTRPGIRLVSPVDGKAKKIAPAPRSPVDLRDARMGRLIKRFTIDGYAHALALGPDYVALLVDHEPDMRVELYNLNGSFGKGAAVPANVRSVSAAGRTVVFATGRVIRRLDARTGAVTTLATARRTPVGLTIEGRRVVWAENGRGAARIRALTAP